MKCRASAAIFSVIVASIDIAGSTNICRNILDISAACTEWPWPPPNNCGRQILLQLRSDQQLIAKRSAVARLEASKTTRSLAILTSRIIAECWIQTRIVRPVPSSRAPRGRARGIREENHHIAQVRGIREDTHYTACESPAEIAICSPCEHTTR